MQKLGVTSMAHSAFFSSTMLCLCNIQVQVLLYFLHLCLFLTLLQLSNFSQVCQANGEMEVSLCVGTWPATLLTVWLDMQMFVLHYFRRWASCVRVRRVANKVWAQYFGASPPAPQAKHISLP